MGEGTRTLRVDRVVARPQTELRIVGELDVVEVDGLRRAALAALDAGHDLVVDLGGVTFVDASGLAALVWMRRTALASGAQCRLVAPSRSVRRVAALSRSEGELGWDLPVRPGRPVPATG